MWKLYDVSELEYRQGYSYLVVFDDGNRAVVDLSEILELGPIFEPLKDLSLFKQAKIDGGTISWPNGADVSPERLYEMCEQGHAMER